jgi:hypothetical protein
MNQQPTSMGHDFIITPSKGVMKHYKGHVKTTSHMSHDHVIVRPLILIQRPYHWHGLPCKIPYRFFIHANFFWLLDLHLLVWGELRRSRPIRQMQWSRAFSLVCEVALSVCKFPPVNNCEMFFTASGFSNRNKLQVTTVTYVACGRQDEDITTHLSLELVNGHRIQSNFFWCIHSKLRSSDITE